MKKHNFDGLDLDWEYPKCWQVDCKTGPASDKKAFADWVQELSKALKKEGIYILTIEGACTYQDHCDRLSITSKKAGLFKFAPLYEILV